MEELRIKAHGMELEVKGMQETIRGAGGAFYDFLKEKEQRALNAKLAFAEKMEEKVLGYAREFEQERQTNRAETPKKTESGAATLRSISESFVSWKELEEQIKSGRMLSVGDRVDFKLKNGEDVTVAVTQVTDEYVRFESVDCVGNKRVCWNEYDNTDGGIEISKVQEYLNTEILSQLPEDLKAVIDKTRRKYLDNKGNVQEYETLLFLPAASEVFEEDDCYGDEGLYEQLEYYRDRRNRMKGAAHGEDTESWWLASVRSGYSTRACRVSNDGDAGDWFASNALRVPVCFCIKKS